MTRTLLFVSLLLAAVHAHAQSSSVSSQHAPFVPIPAVKPAPPPSIDYGRGNCAPRFADGSRGTCVNDKPCNGFGFREPNGSVVCKCFDQPACSEERICSLKQRQCVPRGSDALITTPIR